MQGQDVALAAIGVVITSVAALVWIVKYLMVQLKKSIDDSTMAQVSANKTLEKLSRNIDKNTSATVSADTYLKQRNGRDHEQHEENIKIQKDMIEQMKQIPVTLQTLAEVQSDAIIEAIKATGPPNG